MSSPCETCSMEENCYSVHSCDRYLKWKFPERYEKEKEKCPECGFEGEGHYNHCPINQREMRERGTLLPFIPKEETKKESITNKMSKKWYE